MGVLFLLMTISFVSAAQPGVPLNSRHSLLSICYYIESANNSINSIRSLLKKDSYRNKITTLNNPANNELGFSLKNEILSALQPLLAKAKKTNNSKFRDVVDNLISNPEENGITTVRKYLPAAGIFSTVLSLVGNLVVTEKKITQKDLEEFIRKTQQYFSQYERLNAMNEAFGQHVEQLLERSEETRQDLKSFLIECIFTMDPSLELDMLEEMSVELLQQKYMDPQKLHFFLDNDTSLIVKLYPPDAATTVKLLTSKIKKLQKDFEKVYYENYMELKELIASLRETIPGIDEQQLSKTTAEIDRLYNDSRQAEMINLNIELVEERTVNVCKLIN